MAKKTEKIVTRSYVVITVVDPNGIREEREVPVGSKVSDVTPGGQVAYLNNQSVVGSTVLKSGDELLLVQPSAKAA